MVNGAKVTGGKIIAGFVMIMVAAATWLGAASPIAAFAGD